MPLDALMIKDVADNHARFLLYCLIAALGSAVGSLVPYYLGRAGGELILLKRINRERYEQPRDRFECTQRPDRPSPVAGYRPLVLFMIVRHQ